MQCLWTVVLSEQLKRIFTPSTNYQGQMDFVYHDSILQAQSHLKMCYNDGDAVDGYQNAKWDL